MCLVLNWKQGQKIGKLTLTFVARLLQRPWFGFSGRLLPEPMGSFTVLFGPALSICILSLPRPIEESSTSSAECTGPFTLDAKQAFGPSLLPSAPPAPVWTHTAPAPPTRPQQNFSTPKAGRVFLAPCLPARCPQPEPLSIASSMEVALKSPPPPCFPQTLFLHHPALPCSRWFLPACSSDKLYEHSPGWEGSRCANGVCYPVVRSPVL